MRRLALLLVLLCVAPVYALDWHVGMEVGVNDHTNGEMAVDFHANRWHGDLFARQSDYYDVAATGGGLIRVGSFPWQVAPVGLDYGSGLQWAAAVHYRAFANHGPVARYVNLGHSDATYFVGWRVVVGSEP